MKISSVVFALLTRALLGGKKSLFYSTPEWMQWRQNDSPLFEQLCGKLRFREDVEVMDEETFR